MLDVAWRTRIGKMDLPGHISDDKPSLDDIRKQNISLKNDMFQELFGEFNDFSKRLKEAVLEKNEEKRRKREKIISPVEVPIVSSRRSSRSKCHTFVQFFEEEVKKEKRRRSAPRSYNNNYKTPDQITQKDLQNIAVKLSGKAYSAFGTTCHQCRQKTIDTKSVCRSSGCVGVRGQFCGPCLNLRYGEDLEHVLLDPEWSCPVCRDICNCSICRTKKGRAPTGIMINKAVASGFGNVKDFLLNVKREAIDSDKENSDASPEHPRTRAYNTKSKDEASPTEIKGSCYNEPVGRYSVLLSEMRDLYPEEEEIYDSIIKVGEQLHLVKVVDCDWKEKLRAACFSIEADDQQGPGDH